jgi:hypothetical protein
MVESSSVLSRREFVGGGLAALVLAACTKGGGSQGQASLRPGASLNDLSSGATHLSLIQAQSELPTGKSLFTFGLSTPQGGLLMGGSPKVFVARSKTSKPLGPFPSEFHQFARASEFNDKKIPRSPITGFFTSEVSIPSPGDWIFGAETTQGGKRAVGIAASVVKGSVPNAVGSKAIPTPTPVATTRHRLEEICTRIPPDHMHYISLDRALKNGKPTVVSFATPLLCMSRLCGPVVDEQLLVFQKIGNAKANFIHVEEFLPGPDLKPPAPSLANQSPPFKAWHLTTEPWVFVIDRHGIIRAEFEGPVVASQMEAALRPLL